MEYCSLSQSFCSGMFASYSRVCVTTFWTLFMESHKKQPLNTGSLSADFSGRLIFFVTIHCGWLWLWDDLALGLTGAPYLAVPLESTFLALENRRHFKFILAEEVNFCLKNKQMDLLKYGYASLLHHH